jgi:hypothetical protein
MGKTNEKGGKIVKYHMTEEYFQQKKLVDYLYVHLFFQPSFSVSFMVVMAILNDNISKPQKRKTYLIKRCLNCVI